MLSLYALLPLVPLVAAAAASSPATERDLLDINLNTCIRLDAAVDATVDVSGLDVNVDLDADVCVCIDAALGVGLLDVNADIEIETSVNVQFNGSAAVNIAQAITDPTSAEASLFGFVYTDICTVLDVNLLDNSHYSFAPGKGGCCQRTCNSGYTLQNGQCVPIPGSSTGSSPGSSPSQAAKKRSKQCSWGETLCPGSSGSERCVNTLTNIETCGGCLFPLLSGATSKRGIDCSDIDNVDEVDCINGGCVIKFCEDNYEISSDGTACVVIV